MSNWVERIIVIYRSFFSGLSRLRDRRSFLSLGIRIGPCVTILTVGIYVCVYAWNVSYFNAFGLSPRSFGLGIPEAVLALAPLAAFLVFIFCTAAAFLVGLALLASRFVFNVLNQPWQGMFSWSLSAGLIFYAFGFVMSSSGVDVGVVVMMSLFLIIFFLLLIPVVQYFAGSTASIVTVIVMVVASVGMALYGPVNSAAMHVRMGDTKNDLLAMLGFNPMKACVESTTKNSHPLQRKQLILVGQSQQVSALFEPKNQQTYIVTTGDPLISIQLIPSQGSEGNLCDPSE